MQRQSEQERREGKQKTKGIKREKERESAKETEQRRKTKEHGNISGNLALGLEHTARDARGPVLDCNKIRCILI